MKQFLILILFISLVHISLGQSSNASTYTGAVMTPMTAQDVFQDRRNIYFLDDSYMIEGRRVFGSPFLYREWQKGVITTRDGRVFNGYQLKYDAFHQTVYFSNGTDSLEVNEDIHDFTLVTVYPDTVITSTFINSDVFKKEKKAFYYEVMLDNEVGQLLKHNRKFVNDANKGIPAYEGKKFFDLQASYFYFDKKKKEMMAIKANGTNIPALLNLSDADTNALEIQTLNLSSEPELILFFTRFFELRKK
jgi:hypothetical protein